MVSCDLTDVLHAKDDLNNKEADKISVQSSKPDAFNSTDYEVYQVLPDRVVVKVPHDRTTPNTDYLGGGAFVGGVSCPSTSVDNYSIALTATPVPKTRGYLYWRTNALYSDSLNVTFDNNGMLTGSDTASAQQITNILTELAQTAGLAVSGVPSIRADKEKEGQKGSPRQQCFNAIAGLVKQGPYYNVKTFSYYPWWIDPVTGETVKTQSVSSDKPILLEIEVAPLADRVGQDRLDDPRSGSEFINVVDSNGKPITIWQHDGVVAFFPVPAKVTISCNVWVPASKPAIVYLGPPTILSVYTASQFVNPQRDFLTSPQHTLTFSGGIITGHKYSGQSGAKTVVDTVTAPIRALIPSVSVQQTTSVQATPGKPDQTTVSTQTSTSAPKSQ